MVDEETVRRLFYNVAGQRCQNCGKSLVWDNRGREGVLHKFRDIREFFQI
jgi:hypothetical protein